MTDLFVIRLRELRRRDLLFSLAEVKRDCPFPESNGNELNDFICFRASSEKILRILNVLVLPSLGLILMYLSIDQTGERDSGNSECVCVCVCRGRDGGFRFIALFFSAMSLLFGITMVICQTRFDIFLSLFWWSGNRKPLPVSLALKT